MIEDNERKIKIIRPNKGFQEKFVRSNVDVVFGGGNLGGGKSFGAILSVAEPCSLYPEFRACFTRRNLGDLKTGGGLVDDFRVAYGDLVAVKIADNPRVTFPNGSFVELTHIADESSQKLMEQWKGKQFDYIFMDELTSYLEFSTFTTLMTRNRGKAPWTGKFRGCTNPKKSHWVRKFIDWYIGADGQIDPQRDGIVRYFYINSKGKMTTVDDVVWGNSKKEVYELCKTDIDRKLDAMGEGIIYENLIKSFTFYRGKMSENKAMLDNNKDYVGSVASVGGRKAQQLVEGNWNVDEEEEDDIPISSYSALEVFETDPQTNNDRWITCDLADVGSDNTLALVWDGFHVMDMVTRAESTPRGNAELLLGLAKKWDIGHSHIIFDRNNAVYINDYIPEAVGFVSYYKAAGIDMFNYQSLKDECYARFVWMVNNGLISFDKEVANRRYYHKKIKQDISVRTEFLDECSVIRFRNILNGKKKLLPKDKMNEMLGKDRSMDLLDPCAMRMMPIIQYNKGDELIQTAVYEEAEERPIYEGAFYGDNDFSGFVLNM